MYKIKVQYPDGKICLVDTANNLKEVRKSISHWFRYFVRENIPEKDITNFFISKTELSSDEGCLFSHSIFSKYSSVRLFLSVFCEF